MLTVRAAFRLLEQVDDASKAMNWDRSKFVIKALASYLARLGHDEPLRLQLQAAARAEADAKALLLQLQRSEKEKSEAVRLAKRAQQDLMDVRAELEKDRSKMGAAMSVAEKLDGKTRKLYEESLRIHRKEGSPPRVALERLARGNQYEVRATFVPEITKILLRVHGDAPKALSAVTGAV